MAKKNILEELEMAKRALEVKKPKQYYIPVKEKYKAIKESLNPKARNDVEESQLIAELFDLEEETKQLVEDIKVDSTNDVRERTGLWDYVLEDEIKFFDPLCSYELTKYKPINDTHGLDFDPTPFREAAILYETTGAFTRYSKDSKPYIDFWNEQKRRCREGFEANGYRIPGDFYFFLNFYRLPVAKEENGRQFVDENFPIFTTEHYKWFHYVEMCELLNKDVGALKPRGVKYCAPI